MSPDVRARLAGFLYLLIFLVAPSGAKSATPLRMGVTLACDVGVALLLYGLLRGVNRRVALIAAVFRLVFVLVMGITALNFFGVTHLYQAPRSADAFDLGYGWALVPFGAHCLIIGWLIWRCGFLPRTVGLLLALAGAGYLTFLSPHLGGRLFFPWLAILSVAGEGSLTLWLLLMGVSGKKWWRRRDRSFIDV